MRVAMVDRVDEESVSVRSGELAFGAVLGELLLVDQLKVPVRRCRGRRRLGMRAGACVGPTGGSNTFAAFRRLVAMFFACSSVRLTVMATVPLLA